MRHREKRHDARCRTWPRTHRCNPGRARREEESAAEASSADSFAAQTWRLFELQAGPDAAPNQPNALITLQFHPPAGRSQWLGRLQPLFRRGRVGDRKLTVSAIGARMACPPPAMAEESAYFAALERATGYQIEDGVLTLTLADDGWLRYRKLLD